MLVFQQEIVVLESDQYSRTFKERADYQIFMNQITFATLNQNEQILGVATTSAAAPEVTLYSTDGGQFMKLKQIFGFKSSISYLDFSTDNGYMMVEDKVGEVTLYEIETDRPIKTDAIDFDLEWLGDGLRTYGRLKGLRQQYNQNNKIIRIKKLLGKPVVVVCDAMGTIRLFNYPNTAGEPYYQCYSDHLYQISDCMFSPDKQFFVTSCQFDKCIFKWRIKLNEEKMRKMIEDDLQNLN
jgi:WD40 repeat protein